MRSAANAYADEIQEKAYKMSSCANSEQWWAQTMHCHACVIENHLCTRVNTIQSFKEANRVLPHKLVEFGLQKSASGSNRSKVCATVYLGGCIQLFRVWVETAWCPVRVCC